MANLYREFLRLIPDAPLLVGTVVAVGAGGCEVQLPGGGTVFARGAAALAQKVFVRDGAIEGEAPDLSVELIEI